MGSRHRLRISSVVPTISPVDSDANHALSDTAVGVVRYHAPNAYRWTGVDIGIAGWRPSGVQALISGAIPIQRTGIDLVAIERDEDPAEASLLAIEATHPHRDPDPQCRPSGDRGARW